MVFDSERFDRRFWIYLVEAFKKHREKQYMEIIPPDVALKPVVPAGYNALVHFIDKRQYFAH
jgi:hypothetical protein